MLKTYKHKNLEWTDLVDPTQEEVRNVYEKYGLSPAVAEDLLSPSIQPKADWYEKCLYLSLYFPVKQKGKSAMQSEEIDFCIGREFLITARHREIASLHEFSKMFEVGTILGHSQSLEHGGHLFYYLIRHLYSTLGLELNLLTASLSEIEDNMFSGKEREMVTTLSTLSRTVLDFRLSLETHGALLESLSSGGRAFFGDEFAFYLKSILADFATLDKTAASRLEVIRELRNTNNSLVSIRQNEIIQALTVIAVLALPLTVVSNLLPLEPVARLIIGHPADLWIILIIMAIIMVALYGYFKHKKWL